jgi:hypothetical protein
MNEFEFTDDELRRLCHHVFGTATGVPDADNTPHGLIVRREGANLHRHTPTPTQPSPAPY